MPRPGPRRPLVALKLADEVIERIDALALAAGRVKGNGDPNRSEQIRVMLAYAEQHMPTASGTDQASRRAQAVEHLAQTLHSDGDTGVTLEWARDFAAEYVASLLGDGTVSAEPANWNRFRNESRLCKVCGSDDTRFVTENRYDGYFCRAHDPAPRPELQGDGSAL